VVAADNTADDIVGPYTDGGGNVVGGSYTLASILQTTSGGQPDLADNGGPTPTIALVAGSPAIGLGDAAVCQATTGVAPVGGLDQRGQPRPTTSCDAGAYDTGSSTTLTLSTSSGSTRYGQPVTFTATPAYLASHGTPGGSVAFYDGDPTTGGTAIRCSGTGEGTLHGTPVQASCTTTALGGGSHRIMAVYGGDTHFAGSTATLTQRVTPAASVTMLTSAANPMPVGQPVTVTALVGPAINGAAPTGTVLIRDGATALATVPLMGGKATYTTSTLAAGDHILSALYSGDANFAPSAGGLHQRITIPTTTTLTSSANPSSFGQTVVFSATVRAASGTPVGSVTFKDGATTLGVAGLVNWVATLSTRSMGVGSHTITASFGGNASCAPSSGTLAQAVNRASTTTLLVGTPNPGVGGRAVTFTATVMAPAGTPTGTILFRDGATPLGTVLLVGGQASLTTSAVRGGTHTIYAAYSGDADFAPSSAAILQRMA
jgi:hypothetical protein